MINVKIRGRSMWQVSIFLLRSDMYMAAREYANAVDIMGENGWVDRSALKQQ